MTAIYEIAFEDGGAKQFTLCCGAFDKGLDGYVGCRVCYSEIDEYFAVGDEALCRNEIKDAGVLKKFEKFLRQPKHKTWREYFAWMENKT